MQSAKNVIATFSFVSSRRGAIIFGIASGAFVAMQGLAYAQTYASGIDRAKFAETLATNPALGILYGEVRHIENPSGYMVYRTLPFLAMIGGIWALATTTKLLRGQEEDGRLELLLAGRYSLSSATFEIIKGLGISLLITLILCSVILVLLGKSSKIEVSTSASLFFAAAICSSTLLFASIGALTSQLASTRRKAMMFGVIPLVGFFVIRSIGNVVSSLYWLKNFTPFGWIDKLHPITGSDWRWFVPLLMLTVLCFWLATYYANRRDLYESIIADNGTAEPHYRLLSGPLGLGFRLTRLSLSGWLIATIGVGALITGIAKTASNAVGDSTAITHAFSNLTGSNSTLSEAFVSFSGFMITLLLMIVIANGVGHIWEDESKGYLDNFVVGNVPRWRWLVVRSLLLVMAVSLMCFSANVVCLIIARAQGIQFSASSLLVGGFNYLAPVLLMLGVGVFVFGIKPRLAALTLYGWIVWSFIIEMLGSVLDLNHYIIDTSLLRHITMVPISHPDWGAFIVVLYVGIVAFIMGSLMFSRRDLQSE